MKQPNPLTAIFTVFLAIALVIASAGVSAVAQSESAVADWSMLQHDAAGTGYNPSANGPTGEVGPRWVVHTDGPASNIQPSVVNGTLYVGSGKYSGGGRGVLFAIDTESGAVDWRSDLGDSVHTTAAVGDGRVIVVVRDEVNEREFVDDEFSLVAVDADSGEELWRTPLSGEDAQWVDVQSGVVLAEDHVYLSIFEARGNPEDSGSAVLAFDVVDGNQVWRHDTTTSSFSIPAVANDSVYATISPNTGEGPWSVVSLNVTGGTVRWTTEFANEYRGVPPLPAGDRVYVPGPQLAALDAANGSVVRTYNASVYPNSRPALAEGTLYYAAGFGESLTALDLDTGDTRWTTGVTGYEITASPTVGSRHVYVGTVGGTVEAFDRETGDAVWTVTLDDRFGLDTSPVVVEDTVYVGPAPFHVYALAEGGTASPGGAVGGFIDWLAANPPLNGLFIGLLAALFTGLLGGLALYGVIRGLHYSDAPPRILATKLFRRPYDQITSGQTLAAHLLASIGILLAFSIVGILVTALGALIAINVGGLLSFASTGAGVFVVLIVLVGSWAVVSYRWLPANEAHLDRGLATARREWALVHVLYGLVLLVFPIVYFLLFLIVFQPF
ncbi:PQQ-like domain-containing protein [Halogranum rubrum]|uniref:PQQ-like domain-containing protein n=1 Tax=Halogranum rubrum TaxID=553466 RepID=A0A1I4HSI3_9EURY|nr:PQQ-binding-like beta-propeller repeat protein [Halogranum rubrum]SFL45095.1 PQQ-like domain-containing protein [Halogranum rubrum]